MSIAQFTSALRDKANTTLAREAEGLLNRFVEQSVDAFSAGSIRKKASIITENTTAFRKAGEKQGRTRLVLTEDDLDDMFKNLSISSTSKPIALYLKFLAENFGSRLARHYEIYLRDGTIIERGRTSIAEVIKSLNSDDIIAVRGLNFSHDNTLKHVAHFLSTLNVFPGQSRKEIELILAGLYDRGHIYAQTTGRAEISLGELANEDNILSEILRIYKLMDEGSTTLTRMDGKYNQLLARASKDFSSTRIAMNIQLQIKRDIETGRGNRDTGDLSSYVRIVGFLQKLIKNSRLSADGKRQLGTPAAVSLKEFEKALDDLNSKLTKYSEQINKVIATTSDPEYLVKLQTSDDLLTYLGKAAVGALKNKKVANLKVNTGNQSIIKTVPLKTKVNSNLKNIEAKIAGFKKDLSNTKKKLQSKKSAANMPASIPRITSLSSLQALLDANLVQVVKQNMGDGNRRDVLNLRTGRFAESVKVERLSESRQGMITAFYSYMKNPYATFSQGGRQSSPRTRDPKLLIAKSIREIAQQVVGNRLRSVNI